MSAFEDEIALPAFILVRGSAQAQFVLDYQQITSRFEEENGHVGSPVSCHVRAKIVRIKHADPADYTACTKVVQGVGAAAGSTGMSCQVVFPREIYMRFEPGIAGFILPETV